MHNREVWLKAIMGEFEQDFSHAKWREGYEQGKFEGAWVGNQLKDADKIRQELNKPVIPQSAADWIEKSKLRGWDLLASMCFVVSSKNEKFIKWFYSGENKNIFARAWLDGYEVEEEKRYTVVMKTTKQPLYYNAGDKKLFFSLVGLATKFTRKELEEAGFGEVFNSPLFEVEEVE